MTGPDGALLAPPATPASREPTVADRVVVLGVGAALALGTLAQGAYYPSGLLPVLVLVAVAAGVTLVRMVVRRRTLAAAAVLPAACWLAFSLWVLVGGILRDEIGAALPAVAVAGCLAAVVVAVAGVAPRSRQVLQVAVVALGAVVAASAWAGVAFRLPPLALPSSELWRGASTLTYANAAAAYLTIALIVAVTVLPSRRSTNCLLAVLLLGMLATMSRAGGLGLLVGAVTYLALAPDRVRLRAAVPAVPAAVVAGFGLLPSVPASAPAQPLVALMAVGVAVLVAVPRMSRWYAAGVAATVIAGVLVALATSVVRDVFRGMVATRLSGASAERGDLTRVTAEQWWSAPWVGVGPGNLNLRYIDYTGAPVRAVYTHNEFLQTAAESGVVGLGLAVAGLVTLAALAGRIRDGAGAARVAMVAAFGVHSAFDFLWHVPVLPVLLALSATALSDFRRR